MPGHGTPDFPRPRSCTKFWRPAKIWTFRNCALEAKCEQQLLLEKAHVYVRATRHNPRLHPARAKAPHRRQTGAHANRSDGLSPTGCATPPGQPTPSAQSAQRAWPAWPRPSSTEARRGPDKPGGSHNRQETARQYTSKRRCTDWCAASAGRQCPPFAPKRGTGHRWRQGRPLARSRPHRRHSQQRRLVRPGSP